jgi:hypothetical protein
MTYLIICLVSARVDIIQTFSNPSNQPTPRAKYVFPVPARSAVCAFDMSTSSGQAIVGVAKDSAQAKSEFEAAMQEGKKAALVERITDDSMLNVNISETFPQCRICSLHHFHWVCSWT